MKSDPRSSTEMDNRAAEAAEVEQLRRENLELRRQVAQANGSSPAAHAPEIWRPSAVTIAAIVMLLIVLTVGAFLGGYIPLQKRRALIAAEATEQERALPRVDVIEVSRSSNRSEVELPGSIQAITEAPILARTDGYVKKRLVDIGDRVQTGQLLAEIEAPEMDEQTRQARASLRQAQVSVDQALANLAKAKEDTELARITAQRYDSLTAQGIVSKQDNERYQSQYHAFAASEQALDKAVAVQRGIVSAAEANLARLERVQGYREVKAPFDGVVTMRNVDVGALVTTGSTLLFRIAQITTLRTYVNVPQSHSSAVRVGQPAVVSVSNLPGRTFTGSVARTASALDPTSRTLLTEVQLTNPAGLLLPGMYARVTFGISSAHAPVLIPSDAMIIRGEGTLVAVVRPDNVVHLQKIEVGRDYGDKLEVIKGLQEGDRIIPNPGDLAREGLRVEIAGSR